MFAKPFRVRTQTAIKGSDRKKLRTDIGKQYPDLPPDLLQEIIPPKEEMSVMKIFTHSGDSVIVYCLLKTPIFFEVDKQWIVFPTVYILWKFPELVPVFTTWPPVLSKMVSGADLMLPGVVVPGPVVPHTFGHIRKGQVCCVKVLGNKAPVAVGRTAMSGLEMYESAMRGKGVLIIHVYKDQLWACGEKQELPLIDDSQFVEVINQVVHGEVEAANVGNQNTDHGIKTSNNDYFEDNLSDRTNNLTVDNSKSCKNNDNCSQNSDGRGDRMFLNQLNDVEHESGDTVVADGCNNDGAVGGCHSADLSGKEDEEEDENDGLTAPERMDNLLYHCFLCAIKSSVKKSDLPLLTSGFYKLHMQPFCPVDKTIDVKKSTYKKLGKFLQTMQQKQFIKLKELTKGADSITEIYKDHIELRGFVVPEMPLRPHTPTGETEYTIPEIVELYTITANVLPVFKEVTPISKKGDALTVADIRKTIVEYVKINELQERSQVKLNPVLSHLVLQKNEYKETMRWDELVNQILHKMSAAYQFTVAGQDPVIKKGKLEPVILKVETRMGNKKVTLVHNLELFGIDLHEFAHTVQKGVGCSFTISQRPGKTVKMEVLVQGNQINFIARLLNDKYKLPKKFMTGLDLAPKTGKKKR